jgi:hypothetical protein
MRMQLWAIRKKVKEVKLAAAAADRRHFCAMTFIVGITAVVENDQRETRSGLRGDDQTDSAILEKDLKLSMKLAGWWRQLKGKEIKKEQV